MIAVSRTMSVRGLTEGAILAALVALFALAARYLPLVGIASALICPLPLTLLVVRRGVRVGVLAAVVAAIIAGMIGGPLSGLTIALTFAPLGIAFGMALRRRLSAGATLLICTFVATASILVNLVTTLAISGFNPYTAMIEGMQQGQAAALDLYARLGIDRARLEQMTGQLRQVLILMPRLIPLLIVVGGLSTAYINFEITRFVLRRFHEPVPALPPASSWRAPGLLLWSLPLGLGLVWAARAAPLPFALPGRVIRMLPAEDVTAAVYGATSRYPIVETAGLNLYLLAQIAYSLLGLVAGWVLLERFGAPRWLRWMAILLAFGSPPLAAAAFFLGLADAAFDLRGRWRPARPAAEGTP